MAPRMAVWFGFASSYVLEMLRPLHNFWTVETDLRLQMPEFVSDLTEHIGVLPSRLVEQPDIFSLLDLGP